MQIEDQEKIFVQWLGQYKGLIFKVVRTYSDRAEDADDLFQEILLQIWSSIPAFQGNAKETTWIYRVALNTALVWRRTERRQNKKFRAKLLEVEQTAAENSDFDDSILSQVYDSIRSLPKADSSILLMYLDRLSYDQIAEVMGISKTNVGVRLNRAKKKLCKLMKGVIDDV